MTPAARMMELKAIQRVANAKAEEAYQALAAKNRELREQGFTRVTTALGADGCAWRYYIHGDHGPMSEGVTGEIENVEQGEQVHVLWAAWRDAALASGEAELALRTAIEEFIAS